MMKSAVKCLPIVLLLIALARLSNGEDDKINIVDSAEGDDAEEEEIFKLPEDQVIVKAIIQGDMNASLAALPEIEKFIEEDLPYFHNVEYKHGQDELTELSLLNKNDEVVEFYILAEYDRQQLNELFLKKGFQKKSTLDEQDPESHKTESETKRAEL